MAGYAKGPADYEAITMLGDKLRKEAAQVRDRVGQELPSESQTNPVVWSSEL